ncbi:MAG: ABC transporter permease [Chloroflexota bacterium]|nr:ABC transporter permease [Chloroflexota bacterium]
MITQSDALLNPLEHRWAVLMATARTYYAILNTYAIQRFRNPLTLCINFATWRIAYGLTGHSHINGATVSGFLLVGSFGNIIWFSTLWSSGYAIERARHEGTSGALFLSPASRPALIVGFGLGSLAMLLPAILLVFVLALLTGAQIHIADPIAVVLAFLAMVVGTLACGFALSGIFILSRRGTIIAVLLQMPIYLLAGFVVPVSRLPVWVQPFSNVLPISHAAIALRGSLLLGGSIASIGLQLLWSYGISALIAALGFLAIRRVERVAKHDGQLDLY